MFFFNDTATTEIYTLSLHDALPISHEREHKIDKKRTRGTVSEIHEDRESHQIESVSDARQEGRSGGPAPNQGDRKSTRLNSSHSQISYAVFCLKKKRRI